MTRQNDIFFLNKKKCRGLHTQEVEDYDDHDDYSWESLCHQLMFRHKKWESFVRDVRLLFPLFLFFVRCQHIIISSSFDITTLLHIFPAYILMDKSCSDVRKYDVIKASKEQLIHLLQWWRERQAKSASGVSDRKIDMSIHLHTWDKYSLMLLFVSDAPWGTFCSDKM